MSAETHTAAPLVSEVAGWAAFFNGDTQADHRINLLNAWYPAIRKGTRVLEIGCGQGTCTQILAAAVGDTGHVDAVDPGSPDYGAPMTLAEAQQELSAGPLGARMNWHYADPVEFCAAAACSGKRWDVAVLAHCIWYFKSPSALTGILSALKDRVDTVCIAEYALRASHSAAVPHILTAIARATLETLKDREKSEENIQTPSSPITIKEAANQCGWSVKTESILVPAEGLDDGRWEAKTVLSEEYIKDVQRCVDDERTRAVLVSARDALVMAVQSIGGPKSVRTMDVWVTTLTRNE